MFVREPNAVIQSHGQLLGLLPLVETNFESFSPADSMNQEVFGGVCLQ